MCLQRLSELSSRILNVDSLIGQATIRAINQPELTLGQRVRLSEIDVIKINAIYDCTGKYTETNN